MGHLDNRRKNIQSTKPKQAPVGDTDADEPFPAQPKDGYRTHTCSLAGSEPKSIVYTDQTGRLPQPSTSGNNYVLIAYDYDGNCILLRPYRRKTAKILTDTIRDIHRTLTKGGCRPLYHGLDNECPREVKELFQTRNVQYQLVPPNDHRTNGAERAIRTAKITSQPDGGPWTTNSRCPCGTKHSHRQN
jgi:hypothetical protein